MSPDGTLSEALFLHLDESGNLEAIELLPGGGGHCAGRRWSASPPSVGGFSTQVTPRLPKEAPPLAAPAFFGFDADAAAPGEAVPEGADPMAPQREEAPKTLMQRYGLIVGLCVVQVLTQMMAGSVAKPAAGKEAGAKKAA